MAENFPNQKIVQESHRVQDKINQNKPTLRYGKLNCRIRNKERILKAARKITESHKREIP